MRNWEPMVNAQSVLKQTHQLCQQLPSQRLLLQTLRCHLGGPDGSRVSGSVPKMLLMQQQIPWLIQRVVKDIGGQLNSKLVAKKLLKSESQID